VNYEPNADEIKEYADLVDAFSAAKQRSDYAMSDAIRAKLQRIQSSWTETELIEMAAKREYRWHPVFEPPEHRAERLGRRT
jgi:23S rRNA A2030 N6-methylase RlmJ